jgi:hypothetical protein
MNQFHSVAERAAGVHQQRGEGHQGEAGPDTVVRGGDSQVPMSQMLKSCLQ